MAGLTIFNPIHILPLASPSSTSTSTPSSTTSVEFDLSPLWDCELLQRLSPGPFSPSTSLASPTLQTTLAFASPAIRDAQRRLLDILSLTIEPSWTQDLAEPAPSQDTSHSDPAIPARHPTTPPPPYAMHSPSKSTHKTPFSSYRRRLGRTPKSTLSFKFVAPVPRIPLASVLQNWAAHTGSPSLQTAEQCGGDDTDRMDVDKGCSESEYESAHSGLGLILGAGQKSGSQACPQPCPQTPTQCHPQSHSQSHPQSYSRSRYSRRLRRLAPAPLQLASTPRHAPRPLTQRPSPPPVLVTPPAEHTPQSEVFEDIPLTSNVCAVGHTRTSPSAFSLDLDRIPSLDLSDSVPPPRPGSERRASMSPARASMSAAPPSLATPAGPEHASAHLHCTNAAATPGSPTSPSSSSYAPVDLLLWRRTVSRALDSPLSPLRAPQSVHSVHTVQSAMLCSPAMSPLPSASGQVGETGFWGMHAPGLLRSPYTARSPPPLRRTEWVSLPDVTDVGPLSPASEGTGTGVGRAPLCANLRLDLSAEDLALRAERCAETIARASLSLRSCSLLRDPEAIAALCESLVQVFKDVRRALDGTPTEFVIDGSDAKQNWYTKHWDTVDSLNKNLSLFFLLARQIEDHPPRIHKLAPLLDKLATYHAKFSDLARKITLSHEKLRLLTLRTQLSTAAAVGRAQETEARGRRRDERALFQEGRIRRRELREEMRRVRGTIRAMRDRHAEATAQDENMMVCDHDDMHRESARKTMG